MAQKTRVYYEFRTIQTDQVLVLDKPAQITFQTLGGLLAGSVVINNFYVLNTKQDSADPGGPGNNFELILNNNVNEIDVTNYQIRFTGTGITLVVIIKYYEQPDK